MSQSWTPFRYLGVAVLSGALAGAGAVLCQDGHKITEQERQLVTELHRSREAYQASMERLRGYYILQRDDESRAWVDQELTDYHMIVKNPYILDMDLPSADLRPEKSMPKANRILVEALDWINKTTITQGDANYKRAELLLRRIIRDYPNCDKIDDCCYYLGDIYSSKYFKQYRRAVAFYERVLTYDPNTNLDARIKAARIYERNIADRRRAIELYQEVLQREVDPEQTKEARKRLDGLLGKGNSAAQ